MNRAKAIFSSDFIYFTNLGMSNAENFAGDKRKVGVEIRLNQNCKKENCSGYYQKLSGDSFKKNRNVLR